jgi:hypothetical protein
VFEILGPGHPNRDFVIARLLLLRTEMAQWPITRTLLFPSSLFEEGIRVSKVINFD